MNVVMQRVNWRLYKPPLFFLMQFVKSQSFENTKESGKTHLL